MTICHATSQQRSKQLRVSIIIPVLNESERINSIIDSLRDQTLEYGFEVIVVDGDLKGSTNNVIADKNVKTLTARKGRGSQMNAGAEVAKGDILLFLHADTILPERALKKISDALEDEKYVAGAFDLAIDSDKLFLKYISYRANFRSRQNRIPYGDQAIFIRKEYFNRIGGYKKIPLMEDVDLMRRIKKDRRKICILKEKVITSARRWESDGLLYTSFRNQVLLTLFYLGVSTSKLAKFYWRSHDGQKDCNTGTG